MITANRASHTRPPVLAWLAQHPRLQQVFSPVGACWRNLQEAWWRLFRRAARAGPSFANDRAIDQATTVATAQLNRLAKPWVWGRPPKPHRRLRRILVYRICGTTHYGSLLLSDEAVNRVAAPEPVKERLERRGRRQRRPGAPPAPEQGPGMQPGLAPAAAPPARGRSAGRRGGRRPATFFPRPGWLPAPAGRRWSCPWAPRSRRGRGSRPTSSS